MAWEGGCSGSRMEEIGAGCGVRISRWKSVLGVREEAGCLGLVFGFWKHEEGEGDSGCLDVRLGSGMQELGSWERAGCRSGENFGISGRRKKRAPGSLVHSQLHALKKVVKGEGRSWFLSGGGTRAENLKCG